MELDHWGVRLTKITAENDRKLQDISGIVVVVHEHASQLHYHIYWPSSKMCHKTFSSKHVKSLLNVKGNGEFEVKNYSHQEDPLQAFWNYSMTGYKDAKRRHQFDGYARAGARCLYWNSTTPRFPDPPERLIPIVSRVEDLNEGTNVIVDTTGSKKSKKKLAKEKREDFLKFCAKYFSDFPEKDLSRKKIAKLLCDHWHIEVMDPLYKNAAIVYVNFVYHNLLLAAGEGKKEELKNFRNSWAESVLSAW